MLRSYDYIIRMYRITNMIEVFADLVFDFEEKFENVEGVCSIFIESKSHVYVYIDEGYNISDVANGIKKIIVDYYGDIEGSIFYVGN